MTNFSGAILFDLDGTLLDTAPDLMAALNRLRKEHQLEELPVSSIRSVISHGSKAMVKKVFGIEETHPHFKELRERFLDIYHHHIADATTLFPKVENVLTYLDEHDIPWGIVTNKLTKHTLQLLKALQLDHRPLCVVCGDSLSTNKPDPAPIYYACELLKQNPQHCIYLGDSVNDVIASKAAGTKALVALYGYIGEQDNPFSWQADGYIEKPDELIDWLKNVK